jgi:hypothetical protein
MLKLIDSVVVRNYERPAGGRGSYYKEHKEKDADRELETFFAANPDLRGQVTQREPIRKDTTAIAQEILKAFRKELLAGKDLIEKENKPQEEKQADLLRIEKALFDISHLTYHRIR